MCILRLNITSGAEGLHITQISLDPEDGDYEHTMLNIVIPVHHMLTSGKLEKVPLQFNFISIASITMQIVSRCFTETQIMTPKQILKLY